jgi:hypothetical protein
MAARFVCVYVSGGGGAMDASFYAQVKVSS